MSIFNPQSTTWFSLSFRVITEIISLFLCLLKINLSLEGVHCIVSKLKISFHFFLCFLHLNKTSKSVEKILLSHRLLNCTSRTSSTSYTNSTSKPTREKVLCINFPFFIERGLKWNEQRLESVNISTLL